MQITRFEAAFIILLLIVGPWVGYHHTQVIPQRETAKHYCQTITMRQLNGAYWDGRSCVLPGRKWSEDHAKKYGLRDQRGL